MKTNNENPPEQPEFRFAHFHKLWSKGSTVTNLREFYLDTISPHWRPITLAYRALLDDPNRQNEARNTKESLSAVIAEGVCRPNSTHAAANLETLSGLAMYDMDYSNERTAEIKTILSSLPYVAYAHTTISGHGLKAFVYLDARDTREYAVAYAICQRTLERLAGHPCDPQCARISQPCSCVWDPEAYYNPRPEVYPWREELAATPSLGQLAPPAPGNTGAGIGKGSGKASPFPPATEACGYLEAFVRTFAHYYPWQKGNRHATMLTLGRKARRKGFSVEEMEKLTNIMAVDIVGNGYTMAELTKDLMAGYQYVDSSYTPESTPGLLPLPPTANYTVTPSGNEEEEQEILSIKNEELRAEMPHIPQEIYSTLPDFIKEALAAAHTNRERDMLLLGILVNLSGCLPGVRIVYDQRPYSPHLYLLIIAPSAAGKGVLTLAAMLPEGINNYLAGENKRKKELYETELKAWEDAAHPQGKKRGNTPPSSASSASAAMPVEPDYYYLCGAPNTSRNQIICRLRTNGDLGLIINASELDMISGSLKQDYGRHDDVFRAAFHHESVATDYKNDKELIRAETPRLTLCLSGTPNQLPSFVRSLENGLYPRFTVYTCEARWVYRSAAPIKGAENYVTLYRRLGKQLLEKFLFLQQSPTEVVFTDKQWEEHTLYFDHLLNEVASEQAEAPGSIVLRSALMVTRIASVLTALRKCEGCMSMKEYTCTDEDFHAAMEIIKATVSHSLLLASSLPGEVVKAKQMKSYFRMRPVIAKLPRTFSYKEAMAVATANGISERSTCRYLGKLVKLHFLDKEGDRYKKLKDLTAN